MKNGLRGKASLFVPILAVLLSAAAALGTAPAAEDAFALDERFEAWFREPSDTLSRIEGSMVELDKDGMLLRVGFPPTCPLYPIVGDEAITSSVFFMKGQLETVSQNAAIIRGLPFVLRYPPDTDFGLIYSRREPGDTLVIMTFPDVSLPEFLFDQDQYNMLMRCAQKGDVSEWNEWLRYKFDMRTNLTVEVRLQGADFSHTNLRGVNLQQARLEGANFYAADLTSADLTRSNLRGANLNAATLSWANLPNANLTGANLTSADLREADLRGTLRDGVDFRYADTQGAQFYFTTHVTF